MKTIFIHPPKKLTEKYKRIITKVNSIQEIISNHQGLGIIEEDGTMPLETLLFSSKSKSDELLSRPWFRHCCQKRVYSSHIGMLGTRRDNTKRIERECKEPSESQE